MAKASAPPTSAVITPTFSVFQIDSMVSGLSNTLLKWTEAVLAHVEQRVEVLEEQELAEGGDDQRQGRQHDHDEQVGHGQAEGEPAPAARD